MQSTISGNNATISLLLIVMFATIFFNVIFLAEWFLSLFPPLLSSCRSSATLPYQRYSCKPVSSKPAIQGVHHLENDRLRTHGLMHHRPVKHRLAVYFSVAFQHEGNVTDEHLGKVANSPGSGEQTDFGRWVQGCRKRVP
jgi:hypothetical protein